MASETQQTPFIKQLAASDKPTRDKALESLRLFLTSGRSFSYVELLKVWKGLFYCVFHTANPLPQQRLSNSLASLLLTLPDHVFIPFLSAFFEIIITNWAAIPSLRLDKYLYLIRVMISHSFVYLARLSWRDDLLAAWNDMMTGKGECHGALDPADKKVGDGLRYHVLDVWVDGLVEEDNWQRGIEKGLMGPVESISADGTTKTLRARAKLVMEDERLHDEQHQDSDKEKVAEADEFEGFD